MLEKKVPGILIGTALMLSISGTGGCGASNALTLEAWVKLKLGAI